LQELVDPAGVAWALGRGGGRQHDHRQRLAIEPLTQNVAYAGIGVIAVVLRAPAGGLRAPTVFLTLFVAYVAALPFTGFVIASVPFFAALMWLYGERRRGWIVAVSVMLPVILVLVFRNALHIPLPTGALAGLLG